MIKTTGKIEFAELTEKARNSARRRMNLNLHETPESAVQRLFIATEPDTYIRPHRHPEAHKWEMLLLLAGELDLLVFNDQGVVLERTQLSIDGAVQMVEIPPGVWHSFVCGQSGTLVLEIKEGAYLPTQEKDFASWSPPENTSEVPDFLQWMRTAST